MKDPNSQFIKGCIQIKPFSVFRMEYHYTVISTSSQDRCTILAASLLKFNEVQNITFLQIGLGKLCKSKLDDSD